MARKKVQRKKTQRKASRGKSTCKSSKKFTQAFQRLRKLNKNDQLIAMGVSNNAFIRQFCNQVKKLRSAPVSAKLRKRLQQQGKALRKLIDAKTAIHSKRMMLSQRGGIFPLLMAALPALGSVVGSIINATT